MGETISDPAHIRRLRYAYALLKAFMIPWQTILDPDGGSHEYKAHVAGIDFYIWRANGSRFGIFGTSQTNK